MKCENIMNRYWINFKLKIITRFIQFELMGKYFNIFLLRNYCIIYWFLNILNKFYKNKTKAPIFSKVNNHMYKNQTTPVYLHIPGRLLNFQVHNYDQTYTAGWWIHMVFAKELIHHLCICQELKCKRWLPHANQSHGWIPARC